MGSACSDQRMVEPNKSPGTKMCQIMLTLKQSSGSGSHGKNEACHSGHHGRGNIICGVETRRACRLLNSNHAGTVYT
jgi:hypothetical protein